MTPQEKARQLRPLIEKAAVNLDDIDALAAPELFPTWQSGVSYSVDVRVQYDGVLYKCLQAHTSQDDWTPTTAVSLWVKVLIPDPDVIPVWEQPDSTNPYMTGDKVHYPTFSDPIYVSTIDNNVWAPDVYGWTMIET